jgi:hypothetical protein
MIRITRKTLWPLLAAAGLVSAMPAFAQAPTDAQRAAIKSSCRSDYMAHCSSIPPGGAASLQCLQQNMASLSPSCAGAVKAVSAPSETKAETPAAPKDETRQETAPSVAPAAEAEKPAAEPAAKPAAKSAAGISKKPTAAQRAAIKSNCRSDYMAHCSSIPPGGAASLQCLEKNKANLSAACEKAVAAVAGGSAEPSAASSAAPASTDAAPAAGAPAAAAAAPAPLLLRPMRPREVLFVMRSACGGDVRSLCAGVEPGGGRIIECLATQSAALSQPCRDVLGQFAQ